MGYYFLDTSAVVKRNVTEQGQAWVRALCEPAARHSIYLAQATLAEAVVAFCRRARTNALSMADRDQAITQFRRDVQRSYRIERVTTAIFTRAGDLARVHPLRAYDAIQLACALSLADRLAPLGVIPTFVAADTTLLAIAQVEQLPIENANAYP